MFCLILLYILCLSAGEGVAQEVQIIQSDLLGSNSNFSTHINNFTDDGNGNYYAVSSRAGVFKFDLDGNVEKLAEDCLGRQCLDVEVSPDGTLYFVSDRGIYMLDDNGEMVLLYEDFLLEIELGPNGEIYFIGESVATYNFGFYKDGEVTGYNKDNSIIEDENIYSLEADGLGNIWFAGFDGLYRAELGDFELIDDSFLFDIFIDNDDQIYAVMSSEELGILSPDDNYAFEIIDLISGRFFVGQPNNHMMAVDGFGNISYKASCTWERRLDLSDQGISKAIPRALHMDKEGNILYSNDFDSNIYVIKPSEGVEPCPEEEMVIRYLKDPWSFILVHSSEAEIERVELFLDGDRIYNEFIYEPVASINIDGLPAGTYKVEVALSDGSTTTEDIVIE